MIRNSLGTLSLAVLSLMVTTGARAQSVEEANVPFTFQAGATQLPAGHYLITEDHQRSVIKIRNLNTHAVAVVPVMQNTPGPLKAVLVFHNIGNQHFLAEVSAGADSLDLTVLPSKSERRAQSMQIATNATQPNQQTLIALK
jgi:urease accessory protein UreE